MASAIAHHQLRISLPRKTTISVGSGSALPACENVCSNCGTTKISSTTTETTATPMRIVG